MLSSEESLARSERTVIDAAAPAVDAPSPRLSRTPCVVVSLTTISRPSFCRMRRRTPEPSSITLAVMLAAASVLLALIFSAIVATVSCGPTAIVAMPGLPSTPKRMPLAVEAFHDDETILLS